MDKRSALSSRCCSSSALMTLAKEAPSRPSISTCADRALNSCAVSTMLRGWPGCVGAGESRIRGGGRGAWGVWGGGRGVYGVGWAVGGGQGDCGPMAGARNKAKLRLPPADDGGTAKTVSTAVGKVHELRPWLAHRFSCPQSFSSHGRMKPSSSSVMKSAGGRGMWGNSAIFTCACAQKGDPLGADGMHAAARRAAQVLPDSKAPRERT